MVGNVHGCGALVVALMGGGVAYYSKTQREAELLAQQNLMEQRVRDEQAADEARRTAGQLALQDAERFGRSEREKQFLQWFGTWKSQDGRKTIEISASSMKVSEVGDYGKYELAWSSNPVVDEGRFGYFGKSTSQAEISRQYEDALNNFQRDSTDFHISPPDSSRQAIAALSSGYYDIVQGYLGGDCGLWEWVRDNDKLLEISRCKYHFIVNTLTRVRDL
ncbi:MAG: hypothetical protein Q8O34_08010 [Rhodocyclaceae bacterium]|nr:hypothetical protein [Rhodocyclaceae bacterium]